MTTRSKAKPAVKVVPEVRKSYYVGETLDSLIHFGANTSIENLIKSSAFDTMVEDECWHDAILFFLEVDDKDNVVVHKYRVRKAGYVVQKPWLLRKMR